MKGSRVRLALYARFSDDELQQQRSIADQLRVCRLAVPHLFPGQRVEEVDVYTDAGISGSHIAQRPEIRRLLADAKARRFDVVLAEDLDRLNRNLEEGAHVYNRLKHAGVRLMTVIDNGEVTPLHIGLKGVMNELDLVKLGAKMRRAQSARAEEGLNAGGRAYGYRVVRAFDDKGEPIRGRLEIDPDTAPVVRRIHRAYAAGKAARDIARALNRDGIRSPRGGEWSASTILGQRARSTGILHNPIYIGTVVYNRQRFAKDPDTGRRVPTVLPAAERVTAERPDLAIVDRKTWDKVHRRLAQAAAQPLHHRARPRHPFSRLVTCGVCGSGYTIDTRDFLRCAGHRGGKSCDNGRVVRASVLAERLLTAIKDQLLAPEIVERMLERYRAERRRWAGDQARVRTRDDARLKQLDRAIAMVVDAIAEHGLSPALSTKLRGLEAEKVEIDGRTAERVRAAAPIELHPKSIAQFRKRIEALQEALQRPDGQSEAAAILRPLIAAIQVHPLPDRGAYELKLAVRRPAVLALALGQELHPTDVTVVMVAGEGFEPPTKGL